MLLLLHRKIDGKPFIINIRYIQSIFPGENDVTTVRWQDDVTTLVMETVEEIYLDQVTNNAS